MGRDDVVAVVLAVVGVVVMVQVYKWVPLKYAVYVLWYDYGGFLGPGYVGETSNLPSRIASHFESRKNYLGRNGGFV